MRFDVLTLFPSFFHAVLGDSIIGRAQENGLVIINAINIRDFSLNKHKKVDDYTYGGGSGMVMTPQPVYDAYLSVVEDSKIKPKVIFLSPQGRVLTQNIACDLSKEDHIVLLCGHYEGIDERIIEEIVDEEISIGDYVLTGGELPAMVLIDAICRMIPGVLSNADSNVEESLYNNLLEYPQYTRPREFLGREVPEILLNGHHANIQKWRRKKSIKRTQLKRPDLLKKNDLTKEEYAMLNDPED